MENKQGHTPKRIFARNVLTLIEFSQCLTQGLWKEDDIYYQLPFVNDDKIDKIKKLKKGLSLE